MSGWNYRICKKFHKTKFGSNYVYDIREVYYDDKDEVSMYSCDPMYPTGCSLEEIINDFKLYSKAFEKDVIDLDEVDKLFNDKGKTT